MYDCLYHASKNVWNDHTLKKGGDEKRKLYDTLKRHNNEYYPVIWGPEGIFNRCVLTHGTP